MCRLHMDMLCLICNSYTVFRIFVEKMGIVSTCQDTLEARFVVITIKMWFVYR